MVEGKKTKRGATPSREIAEKHPDLSPGQGEDETQAGELLQQEIKSGRVDPADSTPKPNEGWKKRVA